MSASTYHAIHFSFHVFITIVSHQQEACNFIKSRESVMLSSSSGTGGQYEIEVDHFDPGAALCGPNLPSPPNSDKRLLSQGGGISTPIASGLLADSMGLGKTLSMLSSIVHSMEEACRFEFLTLPSNAFENIGLPTRATLVVVPSSRKSSSLPLHTTD